MASRFNKGDTVKLLDRCRSYISGCVYAEVVDGICTDKVTQGLDLPKDGEYVVESFFYSPNVDMLLVKIKNNKKYEGMHFMIPEHMLGKANLEG